MNRKTNVWVATLTLTAILLSVILLSAGSRPTQAAMMASDTSVQLMTAGPAADETVIVVEKATQKFVYYHLAGKNLELLSTFNGMATH